MEHATYTINIGDLILALIMWYEKGQYCVVYCWKLNIWYECAFVGTASISDFYWNSASAAIGDT